MMDEFSNTVLHTGRRRFLKNTVLAGGGTLLSAGALNLMSPLIWREPLGLDLNQSFWVRSQPPQNPPLEKDLHVDVAVVGGGLTGLSSAYFIRSLSPQKSVAVLEARGCGNGASGRNGAMVLTMTADRYMNLSSVPAMDKQIYNLTAENTRALSALSLATGIDCELETHGALQVFSDSNGVREARKYVQTARSIGMPVEFWDAGQVVDALGTEVYQGGFFDPNGGHVHPMKLVHVFKAAAEKAGATIYENTPVDSIEEGKEHVLRTARGHIIKAKSLVLASNAFTPNLGFFRNSVIPLREYVAMTRPLSERELEAIGWRTAVPFNDARTEVFYLGLTQGKRVHIGGGAPRYNYNNGTSPPGAKSSHLSQLRRELERIFPRLAGIEIDVHWEGVVDWSLDASPSVGCTGRQRNIFYGLGYSGHGVNLTSIFGKVIADLEAGHGDEWKHYPFVNATMDYVPNEPFRWLAAESGLAWYGLTVPSVGATSPN
ncbi:MAG TPA: FAD-binding oxidoreductase [Steroidobacteraceae bacterium]|nr:FAD-binding oxidoreductase [Steroidobacteraceae bacterium]